MLLSDLAAGLDPALLMLRAGMEPDPWQADLLRRQGDRELLLCTRQAGKSTTTAALALWEALYHAPALCLLLSPSQRQSGELFRKVLDVWQALGEPGGCREQSALRMEFNNGSRIIALPGSEATIRGYSGARLLVIDEAARVDDGLYFAVRPMLAVSGGRLVCLSTPFGRRGFFHAAWTDGGPAWQRTKITARDCPRISPQFLEEERAAVGDWWFAQEYQVEFMDSTAAVFSHAEVMAMHDDTLAPLFSQDVFTKGLR